MSEQNVVDDGSQKLSAGFEDVPAHHDGINSFNFNILFSKPVTISADDLRDYVLSITGGTICSVSKIEASSPLWKVTVQPSSVGSMAVGLPLPLNCSAQDVICTDGRENLSVGVASRYQWPRD